MHMQQDSRRGNNPAFPAWVCQGGNAPTRSLPLLTSAPMKESEYMSALSSNQPCRTAMDPHSQVPTGEDFLYGMEVSSGVWDSAVRQWYGWRLMQQLSCAGRSIALSAERKHDHAQP